MAGQSNLLLNRGCILGTETLGALIGYANPEVEKEPEVPVCLSLLIIDLVISS
jgi:hypothetical protein